MVSTIACALSSTFLYMIGRYELSSSVVNPSWWMIFICLTMVDLPDSLGPGRAGVR